MKCVIPCAGESSRMSYIPKMLVQINGKPLLQHIIDFWSDRIDHFVFVIRRKDAFHLEYFPKNSAVVFQDAPLGLADAILRAEPYVDDRFVVALGDCLYKGHFAGDWVGLGIGVWQTLSPDETRKSYLVSTLNGQVTMVEEKPKILRTGDLHNCGMGTYFLDSRIFNFIRNRAIAPGGGDFTDVLQQMIYCGNIVSPVWFQGEYINVGSPGDIPEAERIMR